MRRARYNAEKVAAEIVSYCNENSYSITNQRLQNLLYFVQANFIKYYNRPCFYQKIEAWDVGPVVPEVYSAYRYFGSNEIPCPTMTRTNYLNLTEEDKERVLDVVDRYKHLSDLEVTHLVQREKAWLDWFEPGKCKVIPRTAIKMYFRR